MEIELLFYVYGWLHGFEVDVESGQALGMSDHEVSAGFEESVSIFE